METLSFFSGVLYAVTHTFYVFPFLLLFLIWSRKVRPFFWFLGAFLWTQLHVWWIADHSMPPMDAVIQTVAEGFVESIPAEREAKLSFQFYLTRLSDKPVKAHVLLACYEHCPEVHLGQQWRFPIKIKKPRNLGNPGHFIYRERLLVQHVNWVGYLRPGPCQLLSTKTNYINQLREWLAAQVRQKAPEPAVAGIINALTVGITTDIDQSLWTLFRETGTTHLMVISGAHIGLIAGFLFSLIQFLWARCYALSLRYPAQQAASVAGLVTAFVYTSLAGLGVPAQRAFVAFSIMLARFFTPYRFTGWQAWRYAMLLILLIEPHAVWLPGFYLSFFAVAILIAANQIIPYHGFKKMLMLQVACLIGLMPFTFFWFSYGAMNGFLANLVAIPLVSYLLVPVSLLTLIFTLFLPNWVYLPVNYLTHFLIYFLHMIDKWAFLNIQFVIPTIPVFIALMLGVILIFFIPGKQWKWIAILLISVSFFPHYPRPIMGSFAVNVLDVGQGLSVFIQTAKHSLLYDTGMKFYHGSDMGQMAILPFLGSNGITHLDKVIISHPDLDHRGGLASLQARLPIYHLLVDQVDKYEHALNCHHYPSWQWDGVNFRFFPVQTNKRSRNNSSCVLQISNNAGRILLTGDIEKEAETYLSDTFKGDLASDVLVVPHHGSKTSSTPKFLQAVNPSYALISLGFDNRYHFPHPQVLANYQRRHVPVFDTITCGMISMQFNSNKPLSGPRCGQTQ